MSYEIPPKLATIIEANPVSGCWKWLGTMTRHIVPPKLR